jgi:type IV fimbrial biogenesis protein FimT
MELLVTITVAGILSAIAVPAFNSFVQNDRDAAQANSLILSFNYARSEAIKRDKPGGVQVCPSANGTTCSGGTNWSNGWIVVDAAGDPPFQTVPALSGKNVLTATGAASGVTFGSNGMANGTLNIKICDPRGLGNGLEVAVNSTGRALASQAQGQTAAGAALVCP